MILLYLSAAQGPDECRLAVRNAVNRLSEEARQLQVDVEVCAVEPPESGNLPKSVCVALDGEKAGQLADRWCGTVLWVCDSPLRPGCRRKNWYIGGRRAGSAVSATVLQPADIRFDTMRAGGAGGQHVNKTESAVRATHLPSGISVRVESGRSQHRNKKLAVLLLQEKWEEARMQQQKQDKTGLHKLHQEIERGNPVRIFKGKDFQEV